jgi:hypothetical protein
MLTMSAKSNEKENDEHLRAWRGQLSHELDDCLTVEILFLTEELPHPYQHFAWLSISTKSKDR